MERDIFQGIADPTRRAILVLLAVQAMTPNNLAEHFAMSRQAVSKHIKMLVECDLLEQKKVGREIFYQINPATMKELNLWIEQFKAVWEIRFNQLDQLLKSDES